MANASKSLKSKGYRTVTHVVPTDDDAVIAYLTAEEKLNRGRTRGLPAKTIAELEQEKDDAEQLVRESAIIVKLQALPEHEYAKLKAAHPPTDADHEKAREYSGDPKDKALWNEKTFSAALVAACVIEPEKVSKEEAQQYQREWNEAEWNGLFLAARSANERATTTGGLVFK
jgi:hypothetical protein